MFIIVCPYLCLKVNWVDKDDFSGCQEAREKDVSITDEMARSALGSLGLTGDAALRPIRALSGTPAHFQNKINYLVVAFGFFLNIASNLRSP